jgi:hypothetical protein
MSRAAVCRQTGMKRAAELFTFQHRSSRLPLIETLWSTESGSEGSFISVAECHWEMVVTGQEGGAWLTVRGPETRATGAPVPTDAEMFGIQFAHGTFMPGLAPGELVDSALTLPTTSPKSFWLDGAGWEFPTVDNADVFVERLVRAGLLVHDPVVAAALNDHVDGLSVRTVERRVKRATGVTRGMIRQIQRAQHAVELLSRGVPSVDVVRLAGYADQPHLTRSLKRLVGQTPSQIARVP